MESKTITVNLKRKLMKLHVNRRRKRAVNLLREEVARLTKTDLENVKIGEDVNRFFTRSARGASPLLKGLKVGIERSEGKLRVSMPTAGAVTTLTKAEEEKKETKEEAKPKAKEQPKQEKKGEPKRDESSKQQKQA